MHLLTLHEDFSRPNLSISKGTYLLESVNAGEIMATGIDCEMWPWGGTELSSQVTSARTLLIICAGGFGDLLFLTPVLRRIKEVNPDGEVTVSCWDRYSDALAGMEGIKVISYPVNAESRHDYNSKLDGYEMVVSTERAMEAHSDLHAVEALARRIGIEVPEDKRACIYQVPRKTQMLADIAYPRSDKPRLGVQVFASSLARTYPGIRLVPVLKEFMERDWEVFLFGSKGQIPMSQALNSHSLVTNLTALETPPTFSESAGILRTCDVILAPDSAICHLAGALRIPTVALFGPFDWKLRTKYHPTVRAIQGHARCSPCGYHVRLGREWPEGEVCEETRKCEAMMDIPSERVVREVLKAYERAKAGFSLVTSDDEGSEDVSGRVIEAVGLEVEA